MAKRFRSWLLPTALWPSDAARSRPQARGDGDSGSNTGGMGAYAPAPLCPPEMSEEIQRRILQPTLDGMRAEGYPFVGVLYAGVMLTADGPRVLEFNCRFGDPETQPLMMLLESDLLEIAEACAQGRLSDVPVRWKPGAAVCVVLACVTGLSGTSPGWASHSRLDHSTPNAIVFHAGTKLSERGGQVVTSGGRVLGVTGWGATLDAALGMPTGAEEISFEGMHYSARYRPAHLCLGRVDIGAGNRAVDLMRTTTVRSTYGPEVVAGLGAFGGMYDARRLQAMDQPILVASTDGIGTKVQVAQQAAAMPRSVTTCESLCERYFCAGSAPAFFSWTISPAAARSRGGGRNCRWNGRGLPRSGVRAVGWRNRRNAGGSTHPARWTLRGR